MQVSESTTSSSDIQKKVSDIWWSTLWADSNLNVESKSASTTSVVEDEEHLNILKCTCLYGIYIYIYIYIYHIYTIYIP